MATAIIKLVDEAGQVGVTLEFGEDGVDENSDAHVIAMAMVRSQLGGLTDEEEEECGHG